ncbi:MAG: twin-arginine translocation signal domain-containing protein [Planctomycetes bacterium]|nr:twin-arginine translocation signal domain-containing protein [Planctomycetota bacterium]
MAAPLSRRRFLGDSALIGAGMAAASEPPDAGAPVQVDGVFPGLAVRADAVPARSECGIGALMPWAGRLWFVTYVSHKGATGSGTGLHEIDANLRMRRHPESVAGAFTNRMIHPATNQLIIGPHVIDAGGNVRTIDALREHRLAAAMEHLADPKGKVYFLTMDGLLFEVDLRTLAAERLFDLAKELEIPSGSRPSFKAGHTGQGRVVVANNTYDERDFEGTPTGGRLAEWDGTRWTVIESSPFNEVTGRRNLGSVIFATGWDRASAILRVCARGQWRRYRLPKASHTYDHAWITEWPRIREVESQRFLMDCHGVFYELSPLAYGGAVWGVRPISTHLRIIPDYCSFLGMLVLGGNQVTPGGDTNLLAGDPQAGLWFGKTDDLWRFGKPQGWGGVWRDSAVEAGVASDPYLLTGFEQKVLHIFHGADGPVTFSIEVDFLGDGTWKRYGEIQTPPGWYSHHEFHPGFSAHWIRLVSNTTCTATAQFIYT